MNLSESRDKKSVPKFSSFKPPPPPAPHPPAPPRSPLRSSAGSSRHGGRESHHLTASRPAYSRDNQGPSEHESAQDQTSSDVIGLQELEAHSPTVRHASSDLSFLGPNKLFVEDRKGDRSILKFGIAYRYDIPSYRRVGSGQVLGLPVNLIIFQEDVANAIVLLREKNSVLVDSDLESLSKPLKQPSQIYRLRVDDSPATTEELQKAVIHLDPSSEKSNGDEKDAEDEHKAYRSIHGEAQNEALVPPGMEADSDRKTRNEDPRLVTDAQRRARCAELRHAVDGNPQDIAAWLELIDLQDLVRHPDEESRPLTSAEKQSLADVRLGIYDEALKRCGDPNGKDLLLFSRLQEGSKLWDKEQLLEEWYQSLENNPESMGLKLKYLNLHQADFEDFALTECTSLLIHCMTRIDAGPDPSRFAQVQCYLLLRLTLLLREAGYNEMAVGFWQAVLEFACCRPNYQLNGRTGRHLNDQRDEAVEDFCRFWRSEIARLGEWTGSNWQNSTRFRVGKVQRDLCANIEYSSLFFSSWVTAERDRAQALKMPARSYDDYGTDVDPAFTVVTPSDIREIVPLFWHTTRPQDIVDAFLYFCHLPHLTVPANIQTTRLWSGDNFLQNGFGDTINCHLSDWLPSVTENSDSSLSPFSFPITNFLHTPETLFAPKEWFDSFKSLRTIFRGESLPLDSNWMRQTLRALVSRFDRDCELAEYALAVEFVFDSQTALKFAKRLLRLFKDRPSLRLYNAFALMQYRSGEEDRAFKTWSAGINDSRRFDADEASNRVVLWNTWAWEMLQQGEVGKSSYLLHAIPVDEVDMAAFEAATELREYDPLQVVKQENCLNESSERALLRKLPRPYVAFADCLALTRYIAGNLDTALSAYLSAISSVENFGPEDADFKMFTIELLHQARLRLIYFHMSKKRHFKPLHLRSLLEDSVSRFPNNTMFMSLMVWNDARLPLMDRIHGRAEFLQADADEYLKLLINSTPSHILPQRPPVTSHLVSVHFQLCRPQWAGGGVHSVRAAFERALGEQFGPLAPPGSKIKAANRVLSEDNARSNITIWKLYVLFELDRAQDIKAAKAVFHRAIRACPWSKELVMLAFERLNGQGGAQENGFSFDDLRALFKVFGEKELRVRKDLTNELAEMEALYSRAREEADAWYGSLLADVNGVEMG